MQFGSLRSHSKLFKEIQILKFVAKRNCQTLRHLMSNRSVIAIRALINSLNELSLFDV